MSHTDDTEYSDQAGFCFSKQPPLCGHLSAVAVIKFNESRRDGGSSAYAAAGQRSVGCSSVRVLMISEMLLLLLIAIASPLPNTHRLTYPPESRVQTPAIWPPEHYYTYTGARDILFDN